jgi:hypothetical protein
MLGIYYIYYVPGKHIRVNSLWEITIRVLCEPAVFLQYFTAQVHVIFGDVAVGTVIEDRLPEACRLGEGDSRNSPS